MKHSTDYTLFVRSHEAHSNAHPDFQCRVPSAFISINYVRAYKYITFINVQEQDKSFDIEQQPPFGDRKISNIQPQNRGGGGSKPTGVELS